MNLESQLAVATTVVFRASVLAPLPLLRLQPTTLPHQPPTTSGSSILLGSAASSGSATTSSPFGASLSATTSTTPTPTLFGGGASASTASSSSSSCRTTASLSTPAAAPKLPSEITTGKTVEEVIKEWNAELQERSGEFRKQAAAIAEWDKRILQNRDVLLRLEALFYWSDLCLFVFYIFSTVVGIENSIRASSHCACNGGTRGEPELNHSIIALFVGGELEAIDGMAHSDMVVRVLNNQLSSLIWMDEKAEEFSSRIQKLAIQGSAADGVS
ncbi:hypothetical protein Tsubulata_020743 [Turnera subulata]|uniref:Nucleoporin NSP1-like C-terminal domain-containing protein n=1 Tax=Turnera subulata TaxID=218843 RepID=A0A9Q0FDY3_9ROSI|nr:hypothetical protein Tsubulata_020743 [Turnera subulata]